MPNKNEHPISDAVPSSIAAGLETQVKDIFADQLLHEHTRTRMKAIITEYVDNVEFMKKVREYAGMELDSRMFRSTQYWMTTILTAFVTSAIGVIIGLIIKN